MPMNHEEKERYDYQAVSLVHTIDANVDNERMTDEEFRTFVRNSLTGLPKFWFDHHP